MDQTIKNKWISSLRSGKYKQARGFLRDEENKFCCLGVLCQMYIEETGKAEWKFNDDKKADAMSFYQVKFLDDNWVQETQLLPPQVMQWAGLKSADPTFLSEKQAALRDTEHLIEGPMELSDANDSGESFIDIADRLEFGLEE
jgi:hypothetical protein